MNSIAPENCARCATSASMSVCGSAQACPKITPSPGRIHRASCMQSMLTSPQEVPMPDEKFLDLIFRDAHTPQGFLDTPVTDGKLREVYDLMKWGPTTMNT